VTGGAGSGATFDLATLWTKPCGAGPFPDEDGRVRTPHYLGDLLIPGHEFWAAIDAYTPYIDELREQGSGGCSISYPASNTQIDNKMQEIARLGYVPLLGASTRSSTPTFAPTWETTVPCELKSDLPTPTISTDPPNGHGSDTAHPSAHVDVRNGASCWFRWYKQTGSTTWTALGAASPRWSTHHIADNSENGYYRARVWPADPSECTAYVDSPSVLLTVGCDWADFNCDGDVGTDEDIDAWNACLSGNCPGAPCPNDADFDNDGDVGTDSDIEAFFRVLSGHPC
jgi:hypothetical protein